VGFCNNTNGLAIQNAAVPHYDVIQPRYKLHHVLNLYLVSLSMSLRLASNTKIVNKNRIRDRLNDVGPLLFYKLILMRMCGRKRDE
jgi:hypothetical protein